MGGRIEDHRLLTGQGRFVADLTPPGAAFAAFARSDHAGARIVSLDAGPARAMPGVRLVLTAADLAAAGIGALPQDPLPRDDGGAPFQRPTPLLAHLHLRHVGEPFAMIVADSLHQAQGAAEAVVIETEAAPQPCETAFVKAVGSAAATDAALAAAVHRVTSRISVPRLHAAPLEPRGCLGSIAADGRLELRTSAQSPAGLRAPLAALLGIDPARIRIVAQDVGGSFGLKSFLTREEALVAVAARLIGRAVSWSATRSESFLADHQGRGITGEVTLGLDADLRFTALKAAFTLDAGAYVGARAMGVANNIGGVVGLYAIPCAHALVTGITSARAGIAPYRGHGRPEVTLALELAVDRTARRLGVDPVELRRRNLVPRARLPYRTALTFTLDSGDFEGVLDQALDLSDAPGAPARRAAATARGRAFGRGLILCVEAAGGPVRAPRPDHALVCATPDGRITLAPGVMSTGQGHETALTDMVSGYFGVDRRRVTYLQGDSDILPDGRGNGGSSGLAVSGPAVCAALDQLAQDAVCAAAAAFGAPPEAIERDGDLFRLADSNRALSLGQIAAMAGPEGLSARASFKPAAATFPNGAHVAEIEIDPETGALEILSYTAVEDAGAILSPALVEGQMQGGVSQGVSQVLGERMSYDAADQIVSGSFMDYRMMRADDRIPLRLASRPSLTGLNPLGVKGVGEAGAVGAVAALMSAIHDALAPFGVERFDMPATSEALWAAIRAAR